MKTLLTENEWDELLNAPIYMCLLAAYWDNKVDEKLRRRAIELSHLRTFTAPEILQGYYREVEICFERRLSEQECELPADRTTAKKIIKKKINDLQLILEKIDERHAKALKKSMNTFAHHIMHGYDTFIEEMVFPVFLDYLNDQIDQRKEI